ncbi:MAG: flagellar biosynthesis protein FlhB [Acidobacteriota bacterium]
MADSSKTEQATPKRQKKARETGQIARSRELPGVLALAAVLAVVAWGASSSLAHWVTFYRDCLDEAIDGGFESNGPLLFWSTLEVLRWLFPSLLAGMTISAFAGLAQGGVNFAPKALAPKFERFNPAEKLSQMVSPIALGNLLRSLLPFSVIFWIAVSAIRDRWFNIVQASDLELGAFMRLLGGMLFAIAWKSCLVLLAWSAVDYLLIWRKLQSDLKMTKQEVREEYKETDGNPVIKQRIRQIQRQMRKRQSLKAAATATVIVTNPTHYAVGLRYEMEMPAPVVVAKGRDLLAEKIKQIGRENGIMLVENRPLAQALFKSVEIGDSIPGRLYQAVAEILAVVFRAQAELRRQEAERRSRNASGYRLGSGATPDAGGTR